MTRPLPPSLRRRDLVGAALAGLALGPFSGAALAQSSGIGVNVWRKSVADLSIGNASGAPCLGGGV